MVAPADCRQFTGPFSVVSYSPCCGVIPELLPLYSYFLLIFSVCIEIRIARDEEGATYTDSRRSMRRRSVHMQIVLNSGTEPVFQRPPHRRPSAFSNWANDR